MKETDNILASVMHCSTYPFNESELYPTAPFEYPKSVEMDDDEPIFGYINQFNQTK